MRPARTAHNRTFWITFALLVSLPLLSFAYTTPGNGVAWTADDLVAQSGGIVTWNSEANRYESSEAITISLTDSLVITADFFIDASAEQDFLVHGALQLGDPDGAETDTIYLLAEEAGGLQNGPAGLRISEQGRAWLDRVILGGGGAIGMQYGVWVEGGFVQLNGCRITDWIGYAAQATAGGTLVLNDCVVHDVHEGAVFIDGTGLFTNTSILRYNLATSTQDNPGLLISSSYATVVDFDNSRIQGADGNAGGGIRIINEDEQDQGITIQNSVVEDCAYGIWISGAYSTMDVVACSLRTNTALDEFTSSGAGVQVESGASVRLADNVISGNYAGVRLAQTITFALNLQMGEIGNEDPLSQGYNTLVDNGYNDQIFAVENPTPHPVTAQNNYWGNDDPEVVAGWILDHQDDEQYGAVTITPFWDGVRDNLTPRFTELLPETATPNAIRLQRIPFRAVATDPDGDDTLLEYRWLKNGEEIASDTNTVEIVFSTEDETPTSVTAEVADEAGSTSSYTWTVNLLNFPPPEIVSIEPNTNYLSLETLTGIDFAIVGDVGGRYDLYYRIDLDGETVSETNEATIDFDVAGQYEVTAYVWYEVEESIVVNSHSWTIVITDATPPEIMVALPDSAHPVIETGTTINFYLEAAAPSDDWPLSYEYHIGEEIISQFQDCGYEFETVGDWDVIATIWYGEGGESRTTTHQWTVTVQPANDIAEPAIPTEFSVAAWPNPFNAQLSLAVNLPHHENVTIALYDLTGRLVRRLESGTFSAGQHTLTLDGTLLSSGLYFIRVDAGAFHQTSKVVLVR